jgi:hypothetical protein
MQDNLFSCLKLTLKIQRQEAEIDSLLHEIKVVPHQSLTVTAGQQSDIHFASIPCTQREMSDDELLNEMQDGLDKADVLTLKALNAATITGTIPTAIADSRAPATCVQRNPNPFLAWKTQTGGK